MRIAASLILLPLLIANPAQAFDCSKAETPVEKAICASPNLEAAEAALQTVYDEVKSASTPIERKMLSAAQRRWIGERESACGNVTAEKVADCVRDMARERTALLEARPDTGPGNQLRMIPVFIVQDGSKKAYDLDYQAFRFVSPQSAGEKAFNAWTAEIQSFAKRGEHGIPDYGHELSATSAVTLSYASDKLISALHSFWSDDGGAHGNGGVRNLNLDMASGRELAISDILSEDAAARLAKACRDQIIEAKKRGWAPEPYDPSKDDFLQDSVIAEHVATLSRWSIRAESVIITFDPYAIGPYAEGSFACEFPMGEVKAMALPSAPLP